MSENQDPKGPGEGQGHLKVLKFTPPPKPEPEPILPPRAIEILKNLTERARSGDLKGFVLLYHLGDEEVYGHVHGGMISSGEILRFLGLMETSKSELLSLVSGERHGIDDE